MQYNPPLEYDELPAHLKSDEIHTWRALTGIELIHKEPSLEELNRVWQNWKLMSKEMKQISDKKSYELFGMNNAAHYFELRNQYN